MSKAALRASLAAVAAQPPATQRQLARLLRQWGPVPLGRVHPAGVPEIGELALHVAELLEQLAERD